MKAIERKLQKKKKRKEKNLIIVLGLPIALPHRTLLF